MPVSRSLCGIRLRGTLRALRARLSVRLFRRIPVRSPIGVLPSGFSGASPASEAALSAACASSVCSLSAASVAAEVEEAEEALSPPPQAVSIMASPMAAIAAAITFFFMSFSLLFFDWDQNKPGELIGP